MASSNKIDYKAYFSFVGGQNSAAAPDNLKDEEVREAVNFDIILRGSLRNRPGTVTDDWEIFETLVPEEPGEEENEGAGEEPTVTPDPIYRLIEYPKKDVTIYMVLTGGNLYKKGDTTPLLSEIGDYLESVVYQDKLYFLADEKYYVYDGTTLAEVAKAGAADNNLASVARCKYLLVKGERIYAAGDPDAPTALYYSQVGDPAYFKTGDFRVYINSGDGDSISALYEYQNSLLIFKSKGIWKYDGISATDDAVITRLQVESGTRAYRTIRNVQNYIFFLGVDGVYALKSTMLGGVATEKVSSALDDLLKDVAHTDDWWADTCVATSHGGKYILAFRSSTEIEQNDSVVVAHITSGLDHNVVPWTIYSGLFISDMLSSLYAELYLADSRKPEIFKFSDDAMSDRGVDIEHKLITKDYDMGSPIHIKKIRRAWLIIRQYELYEADVDIRIVVDYKDRLYGEVDGTDSLVWGKGQFGLHKWGWIDTVTLPFKVGKKGLRVHMELTSRSTDEWDQRIFIYGMAFEFKAKKPIKR